MKIKNYLSLSLLILIFSFHANAQDDLLKMAQENSAGGSETVIATFKSTKVINAQTNETVKAHTLDFRVSHLFGNVAGENVAGFHRLYGLDNSQDIRIDFDYGITNRLEVGVSRSKRQERLEGLVKYRILEQTTDNKMPLAVTFFGNTGFTPEEDPTNIYKKFDHRLSYTAQLIIAKKFSSKFSFEIIPSFVHRNFISDPYDENDLISVGAATRFKFTRSAAIVADYFFTKRNSDLLAKHYAPLGIGVEIETGGHVFTVMFTNASGLIENDFIPNTTDSWGDGGYKFSFNISRTFVIGKQH